MLAVQGQRVDSFTSLKLIHPVKSRARSRTTCRPSKFSLALGQWVDRNQAWAANGRGRKVGLRAWE